MKRNEVFDHSFEFSSEDRKKVIRVAIATSGLTRDAANRLVGYMDAMKSEVEEILEEREEPVMGSINNQETSRMAMF